MVNVGYGCCLNGDARNRRRPKDRLFPTSTFNTYRKIMIRVFVRYEFVNSRAKTLSYEKRLDLTRPRSRRTSGLHLAKTPNYKHNSRLAKLPTMKNASI